MQGGLDGAIERGSFVGLGGRPWLLEEVRGEGSDLPTLGLSCISGDAQGERLRVLWGTEVGVKLLGKRSWQNFGRGLPDGSDVLAVQFLDQVLLGMPT